MSVRHAIAPFALIILSSCAAPVVDREIAGFDAVIDEVLSGERSEGAKVH